MHVASQLVREGDEEARHDEENRQHRILGALELEMVPTFHENE